MPHWVRILLAIVGVLLLLYGAAWLAMLDFNLETGSYVGMTKSEAMREGPLLWVLGLGLTLVVLAALWPSRSRRARAS